MIYCELMGGLGNQLFQIFATISYAFKYNHIFSFPDSKRLGNRPTYWTNFLSPLMKYTIDPNPSLNIRYNENGFHYKELPLIPQNESMIISGYYQSHKYFEEYYDKICNIIELDESKNEVYNKYPNEYLKMISMHFRIGDYKYIPNCHPIMPYQYYKNALQLILDSENTWSIVEVLYFCESENNAEVLLTIEKMKINFPFLQFIKAEDSATDYEQMLMMSLCKHNIIANSSFSWFSAYFNNNEDKIVCYPKKHIWFGQAMKNYIMDDLFPEKWNEIIF
jgi:hypothetical protein